LRGVPSGFEVSKRSSWRRVAHDVAHLLGELADRQVDAGADVDVAVVAVVVHEEQAGIGEVVDVEELAHRRPGAPDLDLGVAARCGRRGTCGSAPAARGSR
jgi:hypothetical protein